MTDELVFDPSKKKKKKKTKAEEDAPADEGAEFALPSKKKKKKKAPAGEAAEGVIAGDGNDIELDEKDTAEVGFTFHSILSNKYKKKQKIIFDFGSSDDDAGDEGADEGTVAEPVAWAGQDRDYTYEEMLGRVFNFLSSNNPEITTRRSRKMKPPQVLREGTKKTVLANFNDICKTLHRKPDHVLAYILAELGTDGSIDGNLRLVIKGRFQVKHMEKVIKSYISEYVRCNGCGGPDTTLSKQNRIFFVQCDNCGASRSVTAVKGGFKAVVGKRKAMRAAAGK